MDYLKTFATSFLKRFTAFGDKSAFLLTAPFVLALYLLDPSLAKTLLQWILFAPVLAGIAIIVSRLTFPHIVLGDHVDSAGRGNVASAIIVASLIGFVAAVVMALVIWAKV